MNHPVSSPAALVPLADRQALHATVRELVLVADALPSDPGTAELVRSVQGLARHVQTRLESPAMIRPDRLAHLRAERAADAAEKAATVAATEARLQGLRDLGRLMASERFTWAQIDEVRMQRHHRYRAAVLVPGVSFETQAEWDAFIEGVGEVAALL